MNLSKLTTSPSRVRTELEDGSHMIFTANDARTLVPTARALVHSPPEFDGTLDVFIDRYVLADLPKREAVEHFHDALQKYIISPDPLFLLRAVAGTERRTIYRTHDGTRFRAADNAPAWWVHAALVQGYRIAPEAFADVVATIPTHMFDVAAISAPTASSAGWHIAHMFDVKDGNTDYERWTRADVVSRFVRNIHPCNYFPLAKSEWQRWGGDKRMIGAFAALYAERYGDVWPQFVRLAHADERALTRVTRPTHYHYTLTTAAPTRRTALPGKSVVTTELPSHRRLLNRDSAEYRASRLTFKRDVIEALSDDDLFRVVTPLGTFRMTKREFYAAFPKVPLTRSYRHAGTYNYPTVPKAAEPFRVP